MIFRARNFEFDLRERVLLMGVINVTPDSFSDGGRYLDPGEAERRALELEADGADILDIGAVSTRPGASRVSEAEERQRLFPALERICRQVSIPISVDTTSLAVAEEALRRGVHLINDVSGLKENPKIAGAVSKYQAGLVLNHCRGNSKTMQSFTHYDDVISGIKAELRESIQRARSWGVSDESIAVDPGIGFAKTPAQNLEILRRLREFEELGFPIMVGTSRKSFIGEVLEREVSERLIGTLASSVLAVREGAKILRVHDVKAAKDAVQMTLAIMNA